MQSHPVLFPVALALGVTLELVAPVPRVQHRADAWQRLRFHEQVRRVQPPVDVPRNNILDDVGTCELIAARRVRVIKM